MSCQRQFFAVPSKIFYFFLPAALSPMNTKILSNEKSPFIGVGEPGRSHKNTGAHKKLARPGVSLLMVFWVVSRGQKQRYIEHELL
ncbi:hypothetical protein, partial [Evtepia gabavorous]|jgi:hypothetical protein